MQPQRHYANGVLQTPWPQAAFLAMLDSPSSGWDLEPLAPCAAGTCAGTCCRNGTCRRQAAQFGRIACNMTSNICSTSPLTLVSQQAPPHSGSSHSTGPAAGRIRGVEHQAQGQLGGIGRSQGQHRRPGSVTWRVSATQRRSNCVHAPLVSSHSGLCCAAACCVHVMSQPPAATDAW